MNENHKTVIVLDCQSDFFDSSKQMIDFDMHMKQKNFHLFPIPAITKTMWTCAIEAALEYIRIIYDIFPDEKLIQLVINGTSTKSINSWNLTEQTFQYLTNALYQFPHQSIFPANKLSLSSEQYFTNGFKKCLELLSQPTKHQIDLIERNKSNNNSTNLALNCGRVIYITSLKKEKYKFEAAANEYLELHNKFLEVKNDLLQISHLKLSIIDVHPIGLCDNSVIHEFKEISPLLSLELHSSQSGKFLALKMIEVAMKHFNLSSTTVTGIPMKEEQNAQSSANYDVELLHDQNVYIGLIKMGYLEELSTPSKELQQSQTILLKWCTPKTVSTEMHQCSSAFRITPVDVISRPSSCLINFLLGGRSVMLEQQRKSGMKITSHMLTSHSGEVFIHTLTTANCKRSPLEDPPSISEGVGGKITDYRINDFCQLIKENMLAPSLTSDNQDLPILAAKNRLTRLTKYWPMIASETIIFNIMHVTEPLIFAILKTELNSSDVLECSKVIHQLLTMESKKEPLLSQPNQSMRIKANKRDNQYNRMWLELEKFIRLHRAESEGHQQVLDCLLENGRAQITEEERGKKKKVPTATLR